MSTQKKYTILRQLGKWTAEVTRRQMIMGAAACVAMTSLPSVATAMARNELATSAGEPGSKPTSNDTMIASDGTRIYFKDWGTGKPVVFSHGWPLNSDAWDAQMLFLGQHGYRVIAHDRRGHGRSGQPWAGNNIDTYLMISLNSCRRSTFVKSP